MIDSTVDGSTADGPGGAIFTLDGDVTIVNSTLNGNRADDRGGAISGEADVTVVNSTISRNVAVAHVGGGIWSRGDLYVVNSTISNNYAEGKGGGMLAAGVLSLVNSTVVDNIAPVAREHRRRRATRGVRLGHRPGEARRPTAAKPSRPSPTADVSRRLVRLQLRHRRLLRPDGAERRGRHEVRCSASAARQRRHRRDAPAEPGSPVVDRIPAGACGFDPFGYALEGEQHLARFGIDPLALIRADQRGVARPQGAGCDAGAVEVERVAAAAGRRGAAAPAYRRRRGLAARLARTGSRGPA